MTVIFWIFSVLTSITCIVRVLVELLCMEAETGFYNEISALIITQHFLYIVGVFILGWITLKGVNQHGMKARSAPMKSMGFMLILGGVLLGASRALSLGVGVVRFSKGGTENLAELIVDMLALPSAVLLICAGVKHLFSCGVEVRLWTGALCALWMTGEAMIQYLEHPTMIHISDQLFVVMALCCGAFFWLSHARVSAQLQNKRTKQVGRFWALLFAFLSVTVCVGQFVALCMSKNIIYHMGLIDILLMMTIGVYAALWGCTMDNDA